MWASACRASVWGLPSLAAGVAGNCARPVAAASPRLASLALKHPSRLYLSVSLNLDRVFSCVLHSQLRWPQTRPRLPSRGLHRLGSSRIDPCVAMGIQV